VARPQPGENPATIHSLERDATAARGAGFTGPVVGLAAQRQGPLEVASMQKGKDMHLARLLRPLAVAGLTAITILAPAAANATPHLLQGRCRRPPPGAGAR